MALEEDLAKETRSKSVRRCVLRSKKVKVFLSPVVIPLWHVYFSLFLLFDLLISCQFWAVHCEKNAFRYPILSLPLNDIIEGKWRYQVNFWWTWIERRSKTGANSGPSSMCLPWCACIYLVVWTTVSPAEQANLNSQPEAPVQEDVNKAYFEGQREEWRRRR